MCRPIFYMYSHVIERTFSSDYIPVVQTIRTDNIFFGKIYLTHEFYTKTLHCQWLFRKGHHYRSFIMYQYVHFRWLVYVFWKIIPKKPNMFFRNPKTFQIQVFKVSTHYFPNPKYATSKITVIIICLA